MARSPEGKCSSSWGSQCPHIPAGVEAHIAPAERRFLSELNRQWWLIDRLQTSPEACERFGLDVFGQPIFDWLPAPRRVWTNSGDAHNYCAAMRTKNGEVTPVMEVM